MTARPAVLLTPVQHRSGATHIRLGWAPHRRVRLATLQSSLPQGEMSGVVRLAMLYPCFQPARNATKLAGVRKCAAPAPPARTPALLVCTTGPGFLDSQATPA